MKMEDFAKLSKTDQFRGIYTDIMTIMTIMQQIDRECEEEQNAAETA